MSSASGQFITHNLMPGERLIGIARIHPLVIVPPAVIAGIGSLLALLGIATGRATVVLAVLGFFITVIAGLTLLFLLVERLTTEFSCTDRRILIKSGLLTTRLREMPLAKVEALLVKQGLFGKLFGYGTLVFKGSGGTRRTCKDIENPLAFYRRVQEQVAFAQRHK